MNEPRHTAPAGSRLVLVRHGETDGESSIRYHGRTDVRLSELGRQQMRAVADALEAWSFDCTFSSTLRRASEAARIIAPDAGTLARIPEFVEIDFGKFEGLTAEEIRERYPAEYRDWQTRRLDPAYRFPDGESRQVFNQRIAKGLSRVFTIWLGDRSDASDALIVAHRGVIRTITRTLANVEINAALGSIHILQFRQGWQVEMLDSVEHLR